MASRSGAPTRVVRAILTAIFVASCRLCTGQETDVVPSSSRDPVADKEPHTILFSGERFMQSGTLSKYQSNYYVMDSFALGGPWIPTHTTHTIHTIHTVHMPLITTYDALIRYWMSTRSWRMSSNKSIIESWVLLRTTYDLRTNPRLATSRPRRSWLRSCWG